MDKKKEKKTYNIIHSKSMNNRFLDRKGTKTINNRNIIGLNWKGQLKH